MPHSVPQFIYSIALSIKYNVFSNHIIIIGVSQRYHFRVGNPAFRAPSHFSVKISGFFCIFRIDRAMCLDQYYFMCVLPVLNFELHLLVNPIALLRPLPPDLYISSARIRQPHRPARQIHGKYKYCDAIWRLVLTLLFTTHHVK